MMQRLFIVSLLSELPLAVATGEDFTNNLFSDVAPLLALFGEQFAKQFMSQSMGWMDNVIFAMAPLGILTAIVAAIRIGGPSWLRAVIGRARENRAAAELELMSSTSHEVGELWNGQAVIRTLGTPEIQQLVFLEAAVNNTEFGLYSIPVAEAKEYLCCEPLGDPLLAWIRGIREFFLRCFAPLRTGIDDLESADFHLNDTQNQRDAATVSSNGQQDRGPLPKIAPCISLNLHGGSKTEDLCFAAICGTVLQSGVLVFTGLAVYHPTWKLRFPTDNLGYAYPILCIGTVILTAGMLICSAVVEQSTSEKQWVAGPKFGKLFEKDSAMSDDRSRPPDSAILPPAAQSTGETQLGSTPGHSGVRSGGAFRRTPGRTTGPSRQTPEGPASRLVRKQSHSRGVFAAMARMGALATMMGRSRPPPLRAHVLWLQKSHTVSDQSFDSFVILSQGTKDAVLISERSGSDRRQATNRGTPGDPWPTLWKRRLRRLAADPTEAFTVLGVGLSLAGFILQFQGLRGLHWSASIAQLVAIFLMTIIRAWVRRGLIVEPRATRVLEGYEMDWLALKMTYEPNFWTKQDDEPSSHPYGSDTPAEDNRHSEGHVSTEDMPSWIIVTSPGRQAPRGRWSDDANEQRHLRTAQKAMKIRQRIGYLTRWAGPASKPAISVASSITTVMEKLSIELRSTFYWYLDVTFSDEQRLRFTVSKNKDDKKWRVDATEIESAISLWAFHIRSTEEKEQSQRDVRRTRNSAKRCHHDWLQEDTLLRRQATRVLGPDNETLKTDLRLWIGDGLNLEQVNGTDTPIGVLREPFVGFIGLEPETLSDRDRRMPDDPTGSPRQHEEPGPDGLHKSVLTVTLEAPLEQLLAQHLFSAFMWAITPYISKDTINRKNTTVEDGDANDSNRSFVSRLSNKELHEVASSIQKAGLGSQEDAFMCIIPPLSCENKLPVDVVVDFVRQQTKSDEIVGDWDKVIPIHRRLSTFCETYGADHLASRRTKVLFANICQVVAGTFKLWQEQVRRGEEFEKLSRHKEELQQFMTPMIKRNVFHLANMTDKRVELSGKFWKLKSICRHAGKEWVERGDYPFHRFLFEGIEDDDKDYDTESDESALTESVDLDTFHTKEPVSFDELADTTESIGVDISAATTESADSHISASTDSMAFDTFDMTETMPFDIPSMTEPVAPPKLINAVDIFGWTPLHYIALSGKQDLIADYLDKDAEPNASDIAGYTPMHYACEQGHELVIRNLLERGANPNSRGRDGMSPLHCAAKFGHFSSVRLLLQKGATVDLLDNARRTPMHWAAHGGRHGVTELLLMNGATVTARDDYRRTPLHLAILRWINPKTVKTLLLQGADKNATDRDGRTALHLAAISTANNLAKDSSNRVSLFELLLDEKVGGEAKIEATDEDERTSLHLLALAGHELSVKLLLSRGAEGGVDDKEGLTATHLAAKHGHAEVIAHFKVLSDDRLVSSTIRSQALELAAEHGHSSVITCLLNDELDTTVLSDSTALHRAASGGHEEAVQLLLGYGARMTKTDSKGLTPLDLAANLPNERILNILVAKVHEILQYESLDKHSRIVIRACIDQQRFDAIGVFLAEYSAMDDSDSDKTVLRTAMHRRTEFVAELLIGLILTHGPQPTTTSQVSIHELEWAMPMPWFAMINRDLSYRIHFVVRISKVFKLLYMKFSSLPAALMPPHEKSEDAFQVTELCSRTLDCEEFWIQTTKERNDEAAIDENDKDDPYVFASIPVRCASPVRKITVIMLSHDQGWGGDVQEPTSEYDGSWTWFEAGTIPGKVPPAQALQHQPPQGGPHDTAEYTPKESPPSKRHLIQSNVRASSESREHIVTWTRENSSPEIRKWLASIRPGDTIGVFPKAKYPQWVNYVEYVKLEVFCAWSPN